MHSVSWSAWRSGLLLGTLVSLILLGSLSPSVAFNSSHVAHLKRTNECPDCDLSGAELQRTNLRNASLNSANLRRANLTDADLSMANLTGADLSGANLSGVNLTRALLQRVNLEKANLSGANLRGAIWIDGRTCAADSIGTCN